MTSKYTELVISEMPGVHFFLVVQNILCLDTSLAYCSGRRPPGWDSWSVSMPTTPSCDNDHAGRYASFPPSLLSPSSSKCTILGFLNRSRASLILLWHPSIHPSFWTPILGLTLYYEIGSLDLTSVYSGGIQVSAHVHSWLSFSLP